MAQWQHNPSSSLDALMVAASTGNKQQVEQLIRKGALLPLPSVQPVPIGSAEPVAAAASVPASVPVIHPAAVTAAGWSALHAATMSGQLAVMYLLLLEDGVAVDLGNNWGVTPLHTASSLGLLGAVQLLIKAGAQLELADAWGSSPLYLAARAGAGDVVELLLSKGARVQAAKGHLHPCMQLLPQQT